MWQERPVDTRNWSEEDWERFFKQQDEWYFNEMRKRAEADGSTGSVGPIAEDGADLLAEDDADLLADEDFDLDLLDLPLESDSDACCRDGQCDSADDDEDAPSGECPCCGETEAEATEHELLLEEELNKVPAWRAAVEFSNSCFDFVQPRCGREKGGPNQYLLRTLCQRSILVPDYISGGHEIGYEEDTLCGNIALCLRARQNLERCAQCLERLGGARDEGCRPLLVRACVTRTFLEKRIAELRSQVWWR